MSDLLATSHNGSVRESLMAEAQDDMVLESLVRLTMSQWKELKSILEEARNRRKRNGDSASAERIEAIQRRVKASLYASAERDKELLTELDESKKLFEELNGKYDRRINEMNEALEEYRRRQTAEL